MKVTLSEFAQFWDEEIGDEWAIDPEESSPEFVDYTDREDWHAASDVMLDIKRGTVTLWYQGRQPKASDDQYWDPSARLKRWLDRRDSVTYVVTVKRSNAEKFERLVSDAGFRVTKTG